MIASKIHNFFLIKFFSTIYTFTGPILIAINPYKRLPDSNYGNETIQAYIGQPLGRLAPHVFAIAEDAFRSMLTDAKNQSILVTGESGAGKTETTKYLLRYFAAMGNKTPQTRTPGGSNTQTKASIENQVLSSTPMLEAFGNAKTLRNDNSSRFGKFIEIQFNKVQGAIEGALIKTYLLEKSRITRQTVGERNYHIFYQILAGATEQDRKTWLLDDEQDGVSLYAGDFNYLNRGECLEVDGVSDEEQDKETKKAMSMIGISDQEQASTWQLLIAILHLGNVAFVPLKEGCEVEPSTLPSLRRACALLGVDQELITKTFLQRKVTVGKEVYDVKLTLEQADNTRDSLAMLLYSRLFDWLVSRMNEQMSAVPVAQQTKQTKFHTIGILDIYGYVNILC